MALTLNPFNFMKRHRGDIEQMIADIDRVEETPASRYYRKVEINRSISPYGKLRPYQREFVNALLDGEASLRSKPFNRLPFAVNADVGIPYDPAENMAVKREPQFTKVVVVDGAKQVGKTAAIAVYTRAAVAAMERAEDEQFIKLINATSSLPQYAAEDQLRRFTIVDSDSINRKLEFPNVMLDRAITETIFSILITDSTGKTICTHPDAAQTPKPDRRLAPAEIKENQKRNRAPRKR